MLTGENGAGDRRTLQQALKPADPEASCRAVRLLVRHRCGIEAEEGNEIGVDLPGVCLEIVEEDGVAAIASNDLEEAADVLSEARGLVIEKLPGIEAAARHVSASPPHFD